MAYNCSKVMLGFEDEFITDKNKGTVTYTTNKVGGKPDWPPTLGKRVENPLCGLCQLPRPLVLQIYAPIDLSVYHRTLYLFACINPNCWNQSESWTCIRVQTMDRTEPIELPEKTQNVTEWCQDADDWDDNCGNANEENGNVVNIERISDEDDESCSFEESVRMGLGNLTVDDPNANKGLCAEAQGGAVGRLHSPGATAEIEGDEGEEITVDTPTLPQRDLNALFQEITPFPQSYADLSKFSTLQFVPFFMSVFEELSNATGATERHVRELLLEYQQNNDENSEDVASSGFEGGASEHYEKGIPAHGDKMFHYFSMKIQTNPGQILRYSREAAPPLLLNPLSDLPKRCEYCKEEMIYECQVLPTIIPKLRLTYDLNSGDRLEFGTALVFTCRQSCWSTDTNSRKEFVMVQTEKY